MTYFRLTGIARGLIAAVFSVVLAIGGIGCSESSPKPQAATPTTETKPMTPEEFKAQMDGKGGAPGKTGKTAVKK